MTRKEHIERARDEVYTTDMWGDGGVRLSDVVDRINQIFDDFESRTCESCTYYQVSEDKFEGTCGNDVCMDSDLGDMVSSDFMCNQWETKE